jgi:hypothetical protein
MIRKALVDNETLRITQGKEYMLYTFMEVKDLVAVENDNDDEVIMSRYQFEK